MRGIGLGKASCQMYFALIKMGAMALRWVSSGVLNLARSVGYLG
jgi:hypothetical protein